MRAPLFFRIRRTALAALTAMAAALLAEGAARASGVSGWSRYQPERPEDCSSIQVTEDLQAAVDGAPDGGALCLEAGRHLGPLVIRRKVTLFGPPEGTIVSRGVGTTVRVEASGARLLGFTIDGSGGRFDTSDAALHVGTDHVEVSGITIKGATSGILVERAKGVLVRGNEVEGKGGHAMGQRGDGIRLWETRGSTITQNLVRDSRDLVVWYSSHNRIRDNVVTGSRYGTHLMYSHHNVMERNQYLDNVVGIFVMYSREVAILDNVLAGSSGSAGVGIGIKDSGRLRVERNQLLRNTVGVYVDTSPLDPADHDVFIENRFMLSGTAVVFHRSERRTRFLGNVLRDNLNQVTVEGGGDARGVTWEGNEFDDYVGYDLDRDGTGDLPHELRSLSSDLISRHPSLEFFRGTPALFLVDVISRALPLLAPKTILVDPRPKAGKS